MATFVLSRRRVQYGGLRQRLRRDAGTLAAASIAAISGYVAFRNEGYAFLSVVAFCAIAHIECRWRRAAAIWLYFLAVTHTLADAIQAFFPANDPLFGFFVWFSYGVPVAALSLALPSRVAGSPARRLAVWLVFVIFSALPPFGVVAAGHPLFAAGQFFPGAGTFGVLAMLLLVAALMAAPPGIQNRDDGSLWQLIVCLVLISFGFGLTHAAPRAVDAVPYHVMGEPTAPHTLPDYARLMRYAEAINREGGPSLVVFPEATAPSMSSAQLRWWRSALSEHFERGGGLLIGEWSVQHGKSVAYVDATRYNFSSARQVTPFSEWTVLNDGSGFRQQVFRWHSATVSTNVGPVAILQCYEAFVPWLLMTELAKPPLVVLQSSQWWARNTTIPRAMTQHASLHARLYGAAYLESISR